MKMLIITASLRRGRNTDRLAEAFGNGARDAGHEVETISLAGKRYGFCTLLVAVYRMVCDRRNSSGIVTTDNTVLRQTVTTLSL